VGDPPRFDFEPKAHWDLGPELGILDFERAGKDHRGALRPLLGMGAKLERALINFMLERAHARARLYRGAAALSGDSASLYGTGQLPKFKEDLFKCEGHDLWLIPPPKSP